MSLQQEEKDDDCVITKATVDPLSKAKNSFSEILKELMDSLHGNTIVEQESLELFGKFVQQSFHKAKPALFSDYEIKKPEVRTSSRPSRAPGVSAAKKFFGKKRKRSELIYELISSPDSLLCSIPLSTILNATTFNSMIPAIQKDNLIKLLPECDTENYESISKVFESPEFLHSLILFQRHLHSGTFDTIGDGTRKSKKRKEMDPWKAEHFESVWGQKLLSEILLEEPVRKTPLPFSYTDPELAELPIFSEPVKLGDTSIQQVRENMVNRETSDLFTFIFPSGKMGHYRHRKQIMHRNPPQELFIRCSNITKRRDPELEYDKVQWKSMHVPKWTKELSKIRNLQGLSPIKNGNRLFGPLPPDYENLMIDEQDTDDSDDLQSIDLRPPVYDPIVETIKTPEDSSSPIHEEDSMMNKKQDLSAEVKVNKENSPTSVSIPAPSQEKSVNNETLNNFTSFSIMDHIQRQADELPKPNDDKSSLESKPKPIEPQSNTTSNPVVLIPTNIPPITNICDSSIPTSVIPSTTSEITQNPVPLNPSTTPISQINVPTISSSELKIIDNIEKDNSQQPKSTLVNVQKPKSKNTIPGTTEFKITPMNQTSTKPKRTSGIPQKNTFGYCSSDDEFVPTSTSPKDEEYIPPAISKIEKDEEFIPPAVVVKEKPPKKGPKKYQKKKKTSFRSVAFDVLKRFNKPLTAKEIVGIALKEELFKTSGKTPENTLASVLYKDIQIKNDPPSLFVRLNRKPVVFALREWDLHLTEEEKPVKQP